MGPKDPGMNKAVCGDGSLTYIKPNKNIFGFLIQNYIFIAGKFELYFLSSLCPSLEVSATTSIECTKK